MKKDTIEAEKIIRDKFTERLLEAYYELKKRELLPRVKPFVKALKISHPFWIQIEGVQKNFPSGRQEEAAKNLLADFGISPEFLRGSSSEMFKWIPTSPVKEKGEGSQRKAVPSKTELVEELERRQAYIQAMEEKISLLEDTIAQYKTGQKPATKPENAKARGKK